MSEAMDLDHVAVVVADLDEAERSYARMGFQLTPRSSHKGPVPPHGAIEPWGTGNHCAMFRQGYFELLGVTDPNRYKPHVDRRLARYEGLHLIAFGAADVHRSIVTLRNAGAKIADPDEIGRDVPSGAGTRPGRFKIANLDPEAYPEADFIVIEQMTRDVLWQPALMTHPNGAVSLESVAICTPDPDGLIARLTPVLGPPEGATFPLAPGRLEILSPATLESRFPGCPLPGNLPCVIGATIGVISPAATEALLRKNGVQVEVKGDGLCRVHADVGHGAVIDFVRTTIEETPA